MLRLSAIVESMKMHPGWTISLSGFGALAEVFGLFVGRYGYRGIGQAIVRFLQSCFPRLFPAKDLAASVTSTVGMKASLKARVNRGPAESIEERLARLESITDDIYREIDDGCVGADARMSEVFNKLRADAAEHIEAIATKMDGEVRLDRRNLAHASWWVLLGIVASALANIFGAVG